MDSNKDIEIKYDFFISFSNKDVELVSKIVNIIQNIYNAKCWFQIKDSKAEFVDAIIEGIENAKAFIVFVSPDSANSYYVLNEVSHAMEWKQEHEDYKVLPIVISPENVTYSDPVYKRIRFYLGRLNMIFLNEMPSIEEAVLKIFEQTGYKIDDEKLSASLYRVRDVEAKRLKAQNDILRDFSKEFFDPAIKSDSLILDVGCASGNFIISNLQGHLYKGLLGIDINAELIESATWSYGSEKNVFVCCDVLSDNIDVVLPDYLEKNQSFGFDIIHISAVLLHVKEPVKFLQILKRYLKKDGHLFIHDADDGINIAYPNSGFFDMAFKIWNNSKESGDRHCARKIPSYLKKAGYQKIRLAKCGISNLDMNDEQRAALWDMYFNYHLWVVVNEDMFYHIDETNKMLAEYTSLYEEYKKQYDNGDIFIQLGTYYYIVQK